MIRDITLGQFFPGYSVLHKLDPRTKILLSTVFIVAKFIQIAVALAKFCIVDTVKTVFL